jgi:hypothetical protein
MPVSVVLFHYGAFQPLWQQAGLIQAGPRLSEGSGSVQVQGLGIQGLQAALARSVTARKDDAPAAVQAANVNVAGLDSISAGGGLIQTTSG